VSPPVSPRATDEDEDQEDGTAEKANKKHHSEKPKVHMPVNLPVHPRSERFPVNKAAGVEHKMANKVTKVVQ